MIINSNDNNNVNNNSKNDNDYDNDYYYYYYCDNEEDKFTLATVFEFLNSRLLNSAHLNYFLKNPLRRPLPPSLNDNL